MGAWGHLPFENDGAGDFSAELRDGQPGDLQSLQAAFEAVREALDDEGYIEADVGQSAIAAAALLAALRGAKEVMTPPDLQAWLHQAQMADHAALCSVACEALALVLAGGNTSEIHELWAESENFDAWLRSVQVIQAALAEA